MCNNNLPVEIVQFDSIESMENMTPQLAKITEETGQKFVAFGPDVTLTTIEPNSAYVLQAKSLDGLDEFKDFWKTLQEQGLAGPLYIFHDEGIDALVKKDDLFYSFDIQMGDQEELPETIDGSN